MRTILAAICIAQASLAQAECVAIPNPSYPGTVATICAPGLTYSEGVPMPQSRAPTGLEALERPLSAPPLQDPPMGSRW